MLPARCSSRPRSSIVARPVAAALGERVGNRWSEWAVPLEGGGVKERGLAGDTRDHWEASMRTQLLTFAMVLALGAAACDGQPETQADEADQVTPEVAPIPAASLPDTTEAALWAYLRQGDYQRNWRLFPGKDRLYPGTEPHGMLLTTYVNDLAFDALTNGAQ